MAFKEILALFALRDHEMSTDHLSPHDALSRGQSNEAKGSWTSISKTTRQTKTKNTKKLTLQLKKKYFIYMHVYVPVCMDLCIPSICRCPRKQEEGIGHPGM